MTAIVPHKLEINLFGTFELRINDVLVDELKVRDAEVLLTLLIFWDFVSDKVRFEREGFEFKRRASYDDVRIHFVKNLSRALGVVRKGLGPLRERLEDKVPKGHLRLHLERGEVNAVRFWHAVRDKDVLGIKEGVASYQPLLPVGWVQAAEEETLWIRQVRERFETLYLEALTLLCEPDMVQEDSQERRSYLEKLKEHCEMLIQRASDSATRDKAKQKLNDVKQQLTLTTSLPTRPEEPVLQAGASIVAPVRIVRLPISHNETAEQSGERPELREPTPDIRIRGGSNPPPPVLTRQGGGSGKTTLEEFERVYHLVRQANDALNGYEHVEAMNQLEQESTAIYAVLDWCMADASRYGKALLLADKVWQFWYIREPWKDARWRLEQILNLPGNQQPTLERAYVLNGAAVFALANAALSKAEQYLEECLKISQTIGSADVAGGAYNTLGWYASVGKNADIHKAMQFYEQSLKAFTQVGNRAACLWPLRGIGDCWRILGDRHQARKYYKQARNLGRETANIRGVAFVGNDFVRLDREEEDFNSAKKECVEALRLWNQVNERHSFAGCLESVADFAKAIGCSSESAMLYGAAFAIRDKIEVPGWMYDGLRLQVERKALADVLGDEFNLAWQKGLDMSEDGDRIIALVDDLSI